MTSARPLRKIMEEKGVPLRACQTCSPIQAQTAKAPQRKLAHWGSKNNFLRLDFRFILFIGPIVTSRPFNPKPNRKESQNRKHFEKLSPDFDKILFSLF